MPSADLTHGIYRTLHTDTAEQTLFLSMYESFTKTDLVVTHKTYLNKFKRIQVIQNMFSNHNGIKSEIKSETSLQSPRYLQTQLEIIMSKEKIIKGNVKTV